MQLRLRREDIVWEKKKKSRNKKFWEVLKQHFNVPMLINKKTLGLCSSGEKGLWDKQSWICSGESKQLNIVTFSVSWGLQQVTNEIIKSNQSYLRVILRMWVCTLVQRFGLMAEWGDCCCFTAGNPLSAEIKALLYHRAHSKNKPHSQLSQTSY